MSRSPVDFVLTLHSHLPYVLNHGRWPHGSDWLCEAAVDTYLPSLEALEELAAESVPAPVKSELHRCWPTSLPARNSPASWRCSSTSALPRAPRRGRPSPVGGDRALLPRVEFWRLRPSPAGRFHESRRRSRRAPSGPSRRRAASNHRLGGHPRLSSAPRPRRKHPPPARGRNGGAPALFGRAPVGCWLPECAYVHAARGSRGPPLPARGCGGESRSTWPTRASTTSSWTRIWPPQGVRWGFQAILPATRPPRRRGEASARGAAPFPVPGVSGRQTRAPPISPRLCAILFVDAGVEPLGGYPGDEAYLEFHKMRWPGGLKFWKVTGPASISATSGCTIRPPRTIGHAARGHFAGMIGEIAVAEQRPRGKA